MDVATDNEAQLVNRITDFFYDPLGFALWCYPWGMEGTRLAQSDGPDKWQTAACNAVRARLLAGEKVRVAVGTGHGVGKGLEVNQTVDTPDGPAVWGNLQPGDRLWGADGKPTTILRRWGHPIQECYRVTFNDGASVVTDGPHQWMVRSADVGWCVMTTAQLSADTWRRWEIPVAKPVEYESKGIGEDPYIKGILIGCEGSKHEKIPYPYKYTDSAARKELLVGIMDAGGWGDVHDAGISVFATASETLKDDILWLVRSLGGTVWLDSGSYGYRIKMICPFEVFRSEKKASKYNQTTIEPKRWIKSIESVGEAKTMCVTVDAPDELYCANDFIVTHNTSWVSWMMHWFLSTRPYPQVVCTANTEKQLHDKTWRELRKWQSMAINGHWFQWSATMYRLRSDPGNHFASAVPWSRDNPDAFAGTHERYVLMVFDEASSIPDEIWDPAEGAMTTPGSMFIATGNLTRNTGRFRGIFKERKDRWIKINVDARESRIADQQQISEWIEDRRIDSDFVRVRVLGKPPKASADQFISEAVVEAAEEREIPWQTIPASVPKLMGVDVARKGDDSSVIVVRHGRKMAPKIRRYRDKSLMDLSALVSQDIVEESPDTVFVEGTGMGAGVIDRLLQLGHTNVVEVFGGEKAKNDKLYFNARTMMWARMREWLNTADIPKDQQLHEDLVSMNYDFTNDKGVLQVTPHKKQKVELGFSPDTADALRTTFFQAVPMKRELEGLMSEPEVV